MEHTLGVADFGVVGSADVVLILVLVEHTLGDGEARKDPTTGVLILVLVEHTLGAAPHVGATPEVTSLNPCFSGTYSWSGHQSRQGCAILVLILVLVEHTLGDLTFSTMNLFSRS